MPGATYNIGGDSEAENLAVVELLCEIADETFQAEPSFRGKYSHCPAAVGESTSSLITFVPDRLGHDQRYAIDANKIASELGFRARISLEDGLRETFDWYVQNDWWWRKVMDESYREWIRGHYGRHTASTSPGLPPP